MNQDIQFTEEDMKRLKKSGTYINKHNPDDLLVHTIVCTFFILLIWSEEVFIQRNVIYMIVTLAIIIFAFLRMFLITHKYNKEFEFIKKKTPFCKNDVICDDIGCPFLNQDSEECELGCTITKI